MGPSLLQLRSRCLGCSFSWSSCSSGRTWFCSSCWWHRGPWCWTLRASLRSRSRSGRPGRVLSRTGGSFKSRGILTGARWPFKSRLILRWPRRSFKAILWRSGGSLEAVLWWPGGSFEPVLLILWWTGGSFEAVLWRSGRSFEAVLWWTGWSFEALPWWLIKPRSVMSHRWLKPPRRPSGRSVESLPGVKSGRRIKTLLLGWIGPWSVKSWASGSMWALGSHPRMVGPAVAVTFGHVVPSSGLVRPRRARGWGGSRRATAHLICGHRSRRIRMSWSSSRGHVRRSSGICSARLEVRGVRRVRSCGR